MTRTPALSRARVDRATERRGNADWLRDAWAQRGRVVTLQAAPGAGWRFGLAGSPQRPAVHWEPTPGRAWPPESCLLGDDGTTAWFSQTGPVTDGPGGAGDLRAVGALLDDADAGLLTAAVALASWHATHRCCPRCGAATGVVPGGWTRRCPDDFSDHFPRTDPAVIVLVTTPDGSRAVLGRQPSWPAGRYSCLAGFVEPGESAEQAVVREVAEEAGLAGVHTVTAVATQPWPFPASLMLAYRAQAAHRALEAVDRELDEVGWWTRQEVREGVASGALLLPPPVSVARLLVDGWLAEDGGPVPGGADEPSW